MINASKAFSASNEQMYTGDSLLLKYVSTVFNAKMALLYPPCFTKPS